MDIQQKIKESLAAYVHRFKSNARICNFTNDAATIRIFVIGLKNAHSLVTCIYEKGPQTLMDAISEVEKLNAAQQLTATIIPPSTVNVMSKEEDCCFQCQEPGHIAQNCLQIRCYKCIEYGHIVMDCPHRIPPSGTPAAHHKSHKGHHARPSSRHYHEDKDGANPDHSPIFEYIAAQFITTHIEATLGHNRHRHSHHRCSSQ